jgi:hypothetical protein
MLLWWWNGRANGKAYKRILKYDARAKARAISLKSSAKLYERQYFALCCCSI